jgi:hypothetical protein
MTESALDMTCVICLDACAEMTKPGSCSQRDCRYLAHARCTARMRAATHIECVYCRTMLCTARGDAEAHVGEYEGDSLSTRDVVWLLGLKVLMVASVVSLGFMRQLGV